MKKRLPWFVIQKHDASHLHFDFRMEAGGVLKSWALPKGPPMKENEKHLAIPTEDHAMEYANFEGIIPEGEYGAGKVTIWDNGTYEMEGGGNFYETEKQLLQGLAKGHVSFLLHGKRLNGAFALIRMKRRKEAWLLIRKT
jgi:bifunctional non-homologous end joining protein LigD